MRRILVLVAVLASGCAHGYRFNGSKVILTGQCTTFDVPMYWADGTVSQMHLTGCVMTR